MVDGWMDGYNMHVFVRYKPVSTVLDVVCIGRPFLTTIPPTSAVVTVNNSIVLPCSAVGHPKPKIIWFNNGKKITVTSGRYSLVKESSDLKIADAVVKDEGLYVCRASNRHGWVSTSTLLSVHGIAVTIIFLLSN